MAHRYRSTAARIIAIALATGLALAIAGPASAFKAQSGRQVLEVRGEGFAFSVREPVGWLVDTALAGNFDASVILYPLTGDPHSAATPLMRVTPASNATGDATALLDGEAEQYRSRYPGVKSGKAAVAHPRYQVASGRFCVASEFCEYVSFVRADTGPVLRVSLRAPGRAATPAQVDAWRRVVASIDGVGESQ